MNYDSTARSAWVTVLIVYTVIHLSLTFPLFSPIAEPVWDAANFVFPSFTFLADSLRDWRLPLWDPTTNCGDPFHADPNHFVLSPIAWVLALVVDSPLLGVKLFWYLHWWLGGATMIWLSRSFGANLPGGLVAALSYAFCGFFVGNAASTPLIVFAGWLPLIFGLADRAVARRSLGSAFLAAAVFGFSAIDGGYPGLVIMGGIAIALWLGLRYLPPLTDTQADPLRTRIGWVAGVLILMAAVLALAWAPYLNAYFSETVAINDRAMALDRMVATDNNPFTLKGLLSLWYPFSTIIYSNFSMLFNGVNWMGSDIAFVNVYLGMATLPLCWVWWRHGNGRKPTWLVVFLLTMFLVSLGSSGGLRTLIYYLIPPTRYIRYNGALRIFWLFPLCLAAGMGLTFAFRNLQARQTLLRVFIFWAVAAVLIGTVIVWYPQSSGFPLDLYLPSLLMPGAAVLIPLLVSVWLWSRGKETKANGLVLLIVLLVVADLGGHLYTNLITVWCNGCSELASLEKRFHRQSTVSYGEPGARFPINSTGQLNLNQIRKVGVVRGYSLLTSHDYNVLSESRYLEVLRAPFRFWLAPGVERAPSRSEALAILGLAGMAAPLPLFVDAPTGLPAARYIPGSFGSVRMQRYASDDIQLEVTVPGTAHAFLASSERYAPGWKVWVDGKPQKNWKVNVFFRGTIIPPGKHSVVWRYEPAHWWPLVILSGTTIIACIGLSVYFCRRGHLLCC
jgi:hypothetical protein